MLAGEGVATRKYDGTCVALIDGAWWTRREVRAGKPAPDGFLALSTDEETGKTIGWEPAGGSPFRKPLEEAVANLAGPPAEGTYELLGPKVNGDPEGYGRHVLVRHADAEVLDLPAGDVEAVKAAVLALAERGYEGVVWHHEDGRMAKLKVRDLR